MLFALYRGCAGYPDSLADHVVRFVMQFRALGVYCLAMAWRRVRVRLGSVCSEDSELYVAHPALNLIAEAGTVVGKAEGVMAAVRLRAKRRCWEAVAGG